MSAFVFETISSAQAAAYDGAADSLAFQTPGVYAALSTLAYVPASASAPEMVAITVMGQTAMFGAGIYGDQDIRFSDGSMLFVGGTGSDSMSGTAFADAIFGGQGADTLFGGDGADFLQGNQGADSLVGGVGDDFVYGGQGDDTIEVREGANFGQGNLGNDTVTAAVSTERNLLLGGQGDDVVIGGAAADFLNGNLGADSIVGGAGGDTLSGEGGADTLDGGADSDLFLIAAGSSDVTLAGADRILNWSSEDRIDVPGFGGLAAYYQIPAALIVSGGGYDPYGYDYEPDPGMNPGGGLMYAAIPFATALARANSWIDDHPSEIIVTAQVDDGVAIFIDSNGDRRADLSIILVGKSLSDVTAFNFI